jgi:hypothetical protein
MSILSALERNQEHKEHLLAHVGLIPNRNFVWRHLHDDRVELLVGEREEGLLSRVLLYLSRTSRIAAQQVHNPLDTRIYGFEEYGTDAKGVPP